MLSKKFVNRLREIFNIPSSVTDEEVINKWKEVSYLIIETVEEGESVLLPDLGKFKYCKIRREDTAQDNRISFHKVPIASTCNNDIHKDIETFINRIKELGYQIDYGNYINDNILDDIDINLRKFSKM